MLELEGVDIIQTEGGKCSNPSKSGVLGLIEKVTQKNFKKSLLLYSNFNFPPKKKSDYAYKIW